MSPQPRSDDGRRDVWLLLGLACASAAGVAATQHHAATIGSKVKERGEVYLLPPPDELKVMSIGYRAALADVLWANLLVTQGFRTQERLRYSNVVPGLESISELDPQFREPYLYADSLILYQAVAAPIEDVRAVRTILEQGIKNRPLDGEIWLLLGQYLSFRAPASFLKDEDEKARWRTEGLLYLERAVELAGANSNIAWQALGGGSHYKRAGERDAAIRFYQKVLATTEDEELAASARASLDALLRDEERHGAEERSQAMVEAARAEAESFEWLEPIKRATRRIAFTGLPRTAMLSMSPPLDGYACAGGAASTRALEPVCARTWVEWSARELAKR